MAAGIHPTSLPEADLIGTDIRAAPKVEASSDDVVELGRTRGAVPHGLAKLHAIPVPLR
jgi:hypothetical protein